MYRLTQIQFCSFQDIFIIGELNSEDKFNIVKILRTISRGEYAGYNPKEQDKYKAIIKITEKYDKPVITTYNCRNNLVWRLK